MSRYEIRLHRAAQKALHKAPERIQKKAVTFIKHLTKHGTRNPPFPVKPLHGKFKKYKYLEAKIEDDYRIFFRREGNVFFVRQAGTHNSLGTG